MKPCAVLACATQNVLTIVLPYLTIAAACPASFGMPSCCSRRRSRGGQTSGMH